MIGISGNSIPAVRNARAISTMPIEIAMATITMKLGLSRNSDARTMPTRPRPTAMAAGRSRPARLFFSAGGSDFKELCFFVLEQSVDVFHVFLGQAVEALFAAGDFIFADVTILFGLVHRLLGGAAQVADRNPAVLGLRAGQLDEFLAAVFGEFGHRDTENPAIVGGIHAEIRVANGLLDGRLGSDVVRVDDDHPRFGHGETGPLLDRGLLSVVVGGELGEHRRMGTTGADCGKVLTGMLDGLGHFGIGFAQSLVNHGVHSLSCPAVSLRGPAFRSSHHGGPWRCCPRPPCRKRSWEVCSPYTGRTRPRRQL